MSADKKTNRQRIADALAKKQAQDAAKRQVMANGDAPRRPKKPRPDRSAAGRDRKMAAKGRLPDGATIDAKYLAGRGVWVARLYVPTTEGELGEVTHKPFEHQADGLFRCLEELDEKFRNWKADQEAKTDG